MPRSLAVVPKWLESATASRGRPNARALPRATRCVAGYCGDGQVTYRIAHVSDSHLGRDKTYFVANFLRVATHLAIARPNLVLNGGDMSLDGAADLDESKRLHDGLAQPVRFIPGNHDLGESQEREYRSSPRSCGLAICAASGRIIGASTLRVGASSRSTANCSQQSAGRRRAIPLRPRRGCRDRQAQPGAVHPQAPVPRRRG
jgi:hypothetical protein